MIRANLVAERVAIEAYSQMIALIGDKDVDDAPRARVHPQPGAGARRRAQRLAERMNARPVSVSMPVDGGACHRQSMQNS